MSFIKGERASRPLRPQAGRMPVLVWICAFQRYGPDKASHFSEFAGNAPCGLRLRALKLLVTTEFPPNAAGGGPAVVHQMLKGYPGDISWWRCGPERDQHFGQQVFALRRAGTKKLPARRHAESLL